MLPLAEEIKEKRWREKNEEEEESAQERGRKERA
jgi:hypothetical protein